MTGALDGLVIADFGRVLAGPYATMLLADFGAEVVKVERPGVGDDTRSWGPPWVGDESTYFLAVNRNKTSMSIDLTTDDGRADARALVDRADVVVENFLPGTMDRLGFGYEELSAADPRIVYCSITGFGGGSDLPGYDLVIQAVGGFMSVTGPDASSPTKAGIAVVDIMTGLHAALGILTALRHRDRTGEGQRVEVDLLSSLMSAMTNQTAGYINAGVVPTAMGNRHPSIAPYAVFRASDRPLVLAVGNDRQFGSLAEVLGIGRVATDPKFVTNEMRVANRDELIEILNERLATDTADAWFAALSAARVPCGPLNNVAEAVAFAQSLDPGRVVTIDDGTRDVPVRQIANPITLSATPATYRTPPPRLG